MNHKSANGDTKYIDRKVRRFIMLGKPLGKGWRFHGTSSGPNGGWVSYSKIVIRRSGDE